MFTRMFKQDGGFYNALPHEIEPMKEQGWTEVVAAAPKTDTITVHDAPRRGRPRKEVPVIQEVKDADDGNSTDAD